MTDETYDNLPRYINHSCDANLALHIVRVETFSPPKVALVAVRDIKAGEELTFDYGTENSTSRVDDARKECLCGSEKCRKFMPLHIFNQV